MKIQIPTTCPCCDYPLQLVNEQLFCRNTSCSAQLGKKVEHFAKTLGIKGLGPKTVAALNLQDLTEIFYLDFELVAFALGSEKIAEKLLDEIDRATQADLATVLASFSIPLIGNTASQKICKVVDNIDQITQETCKQAGLGEKATQNLLSWLETDFQEMREFLPFSFVSVKQTTSSALTKTICITGKLSSFKTKKEAHAAIEAAGYQVMESVTKTLDYLVDEQNDGSSKRKKAEQYGIQIISNLTQFLKESN